VIYVGGMRAVTGGMRVVAGLFVLAFAIGACSLGSSEDAAKSEVAVNEAQPDPSVRGRGGVAVSNGVRTSDASSTPEAPSGFEVNTADLFRFEPKIIKNGEIALQVGRDDFVAAVDRVFGVARRYDGIVKSTTIDDAGEKHGTIVLSVPSGSFEDVLTALDDIGNLKRQFVDSQDVTEEFVDLQARVRNARAQETVLLRLMDDAASISDTIRVQRELERVQQLIEQMSSQLRLLRDQTSFSTVTVELTERGAPAQSPNGDSTLASAWTDAREAFLGVVSAVIVGAGFLIPVAALVIAGALGFRWVTRQRGAEA
jgi:hypothetical protein